MNVLITGATGFVGSNLINLLLEHNYSVAIFKRQKSSLKRLKNIENKIKIFNSDTYDDIMSGIRIFAPDIVIHLATFFISNHNSENIFDMINSNIIFGTYILEAMTKSKASLFLNIGTRWQHLRNKRYLPVNFYAATKEAFRNILIYYESKGIFHKTIELSDTFGDGDTRQKVLSLLIKSCKNKEILELTPGEQKLDLLYVEDICNFIMKSIQTRNFFDNKVITLSGKVIKLKDLGKVVEERYETQGLFKWGKRPYRENEVMEMPKYYHEIKLNENSLETYLRESYD